MFYATVMACHGQKNKLLISTYIHIIIMTSYMFNVTLILCFEGRSKPKRIGFQRPHTLDDRQYVWENVHGEFPVGHGCSASSDRHKWWHGIALGLVQRSSGTDKVIVVLWSWPDKSWQFRVHAVALGRSFRKCKMRWNTLSECKKIKLN